MNLSISGAATTKVFVALVPSRQQILKDYQNSEESKCLAALSKDMDKVYAQLTKQSAEAICKAYKICK
ncbi:hypothetical protein TELCIR_10890 [Teladorsagia circumcincta]|uniref:Surfactant protein B n=1 Tax=Teladorsagia circumcincta TaxID=45464 RepID=A0A2G9UB02_TELCI|nr:hypothetical protein TELCIR_10890 [Teladorsagia circumcincta]